MGKPVVELSTDVLLQTPTLGLRDIVCAGDCRAKGVEECALSTFLVFPYRGVFVRHVGRNEAVGEANQVLFFNQGETYCISHPVAGGDACLSLEVAPACMHELAPTAQLRQAADVAFRLQRLRIDAHAQSLVALLRHKLARQRTETLEAESLVLALVGRALGERTSHMARGSAGRQKLVDRAKLVLASDLSRRWTLTEIASEVGVSPVYLTQVFRLVEAMPLYRYQLRLRLARALDLLGEYDDLSRLSLELGFSSHSHFTSAFRQVYGTPPVEFQRSLGTR